MKLLYQWLLGDWIRPCRWNRSFTDARISLFMNAVRGTAIRNQIMFIIAHCWALAGVTKYSWHHCATLSTCWLQAQLIGPEEGPAACVPAVIGPYTSLTMFNGVKLFPLQRYFPVKSVLVTSLRILLFLELTWIYFVGYFSLVIYSPKTNSTLQNSYGVTFILYLPLRHTYSCSVELYFWHQRPILYPLQGLDNSCFHTELHRDEYCSCFKESQLPKYIIHSIQNIAGQKKLKLFKLSLNERDSEQQQKKKRSQMQWKQ